MSVNGLKVIEIINRIGDAIEENKAFLSEIDAIGDGDHGINMSKGFKAAIEMLKQYDGYDVGEILRKTGTALIYNAGGASGVLYGTAFLKGAEQVKGRKNIDISDFARILEAAIDEIKRRGKTKSKDKTMIDAMEPALDALKDALRKGDTPLEAIGEAAKAAYKGAEQTKEIAAAKGKAKYLGEKSIGHQDAGATSSAIILYTIYVEIKGYDEINGRNCYCVS